ncbi:MAG: PRC-barrel domain-containing protein [Chloroflexota bacterium]|nr:PRC-barrel domain-containing protein [Chloroflexota bacterium]
MLNRIERGATVHTQDGPFGEVYQVIVDPDSKDLTHIVVRPMAGGSELMIPASMIAEATGHDVRLNVTVAAMDGMRDQLRYDESEFQPVDPDQVEMQGTEPQSGQVITEASNTQVEFGAPGSGTGEGTTDRFGTRYAPADAGAAESRSGTDVTYTAGGTERSVETAGEAEPATYDTDTSTVEHYPQGTGRNRKGKELVGLPIVTFSEGEQIGKVRDILFDPDQNRVVALLTDEGGWFSSARVVPWQNLQTIGEDAIIVPDRGAEVKADSDRYIQHIMQTDNTLTGTRVFTDDGRDLGTIGDMYVDDSTGQVTGYEVSGGLFASTLKGKKFMPAPETITMGRDVAFVPSEVGDAMQEQTGGLAGAAQSAQQSASSALSSAQESATGALSTAKDKVATATADQQRSFVVGKTVNSDVTSDSGDVLVPAGKVVDETDVERAESEGKLNALFMAAGGAQASGVLGTVRDKVSQVGSQVASGTTAQRDQQLQNSVGKTAGRDVYADDGTVVALQGTVIDPSTVERARAYGKENQLLAAVGAASTQETVSQAKEGIASAFGSLRGKVEELTAQQRESREQSRIRNALGRPVSRVILDPSDNVILETGQIITNQAIDQARASGVLDILLDSVYEADPDFSPDVLHSGIDGQASLPGNLEEKRKPEEPLS